MHYNMALGCIAMHNNIALLEGIVMHYNAFECLRSKDLELKKRIHNNTIFIFYRGARSSKQAPPGP
jgi:hypothetical protein